MVNVSTGITQCPLPWSHYEALGWGWESEAWLKAATKKQRDTRHQAYGIITYVIIHYLISYIVPFSSWRCAQVMQRAAIFRH